MTTESTPATLAALADLSAAVTNAERVAQVRRDDRDLAIRRLLDQGVSVALIQAATGLHRQRIYQVRDGRR